MTFHHFPASEAIQSLDSDPVPGLRSEQVQERLASFGENKLKEKKKKQTSSDFWHSSRT